VNLSRDFVAHALACYNIIMIPNSKPNIHNRPSHLKQNDSFYFITGRTIEGQWFLRSDSYKQILLQKIQEKTVKFGYKLIAYVILNNHYHLVLQILDAGNISKFMAELNGASSREINIADHVLNRKIWWNFYDHIIRDEADFFKHLNYIHQNPIKHGQADDLDYPFSSYNAWVKKKGVAYLEHAFEKYPIIDFKSFNDEF
jgi:putative transposase